MDRKAPRPRLKKEPRTTGARRPRGPQPRQEDLRTEDAFKLLMECMTDFAICLFDLEGKVASWNKGAERILGWKEQDVLGKPNSIFFPPEEGDRPQRELEIASREGSADDENWLIRRNGERFWADGVTTALVDETGRLRAFAKVFRDLTDRKRKEDDLRRVVGRLDSLLQSTQEGIFGVDLKGRCTFINRAGAEMLGYQPGELLGLDLHERIHGRRSDGTVHALEECPIYATLRSGIRSRVDGEVLWTSEGRKVPVEYSTSPILEDGRVTGAVITFVDVSERLRKEEEIRRLTGDLERRVHERTEALERALQEMGTFSYTVAHDLRAPLRAMAGFAQALAEDYGPRLDQTGRGYADRIYEAARRMDALIVDLLSYSRLSRTDLDLRDLDLSQVVRDVLGEMTSEIRARSADILVEEPLGTVMAHELTLKLAINNLVSNAIKFVPHGVHPIVRIRSEKNAPWVRLWVEDNGIGIPEEQSERIFGVFERLVRAEEYPGTGIGLAIVRKGAERMGGRVGVTSSPGQGSRFWIELRQPMS
jgi:PAS domain S-box-containing protein